MRSTVEIAPGGTRPAIRLRPVPRFDPPFDDELSPEVWSSARRLPLNWSVAPRPPTEADADPDPPAGHTPVAGGGPAPVAAGGPASMTLGGPASLAARGPGSIAVGDAASIATGAVAPVVAGGPASMVAGGSAPVVAGASSDARLAVRRFVHLCVEVLNGYRPAGHLRRMSRPMDAAGVVAEGLAGARRVTRIRDASRVGNRRPRRPVPVGVLRVRLCEPRPGAVEAAVALMLGDRTWAMALRMELHQQSWAVTTLRLI